MEKLKKVFFSLSVINITIVAFLTFLSIITLIYVERIPESLNIFVYNIITITFIFWLTYKQVTSRKRIFKQLEYAYLPVMIFFVFRELYFMTDPINGVVYDWFLIDIDKTLFGVNPTYVLYKIANPVLTEILQLAYSSYYFLPIILAFDLIRRGDEDKADYMLFMVFYGFFLSYFGYLTIPAIGPRFTLHNFANIEHELPGLFFTHYLRELINSGEGISNVTLFPMLEVQRDAFPSGHTEITLIVLYFAAKFKAKTRYFLFPIGILLIFATVYLRYHYVIDLIGGTFFMIYAVWSGKYLFEFWTKKREKYI